MTITARYAGRCALCNKAITPGELIEWDRADRRSLHMVCTVAPTPKEECFFKGEVGACDCADCAGGAK
jgi:hypothetical protein